MNNEKLKQAEEYYLNQDYVLASDIYKNLLQEESENPYLLINFANTQFHQKQYAKALAHYFKAKTLIPRDKELNNNINYAIQEIKANKLKDIYPGMFFTISESLILLIAFNLLFLIFRKSKYTTIKYLCLGLLIFSLGNAAYVTWLTNYKKFAFINVISTETYAGNDTSYPQMFELFKAQPIEILEIDGGWAKIKYENQIAWLQNDKFIAVRSNAL
jgi:tetratricopeptide (TPR) repeat protein